MNLSYLMNMQKEILTLPSNGMVVTAVEFNCDSSPECDNLVINNFVFSNELGLLTYTDMDGRNWKKVN